MHLPSAHYSQESRRREMAGFPEKVLFGDKDREGLELTLATRTLQLVEETRKRKAACALRRMQAKKRQMKREKAGGNKSRDAIGLPAAGAETLSNDASKYIIRLAQIVCDQGVMASHVPGLDNLLAVHAKGDGPNPRTIEGIVFSKWREGEIRIMCACHCSILSTAEFVLHAGRGHVDNPHRFINMGCPSAHAL